MNALAIIQPIQHHAEQNIKNMFMLPPSVSPLSPSPISSIFSVHSLTFACSSRQIGDCCSLYTAELEDILFALQQAYRSKESKFMIFSDYLSALQAQEELKTHFFCQYDMYIKLMQTIRKQFLSGFMDMLAFGKKRLLIELLKKLQTRNLQMTSCPFQT